MEQNENTLSVLKIAPGQYPQQVEINNDLKALQQAVGGSIGEMCIRDSVLLAQGILSFYPHLPSGVIQ